MKKILVKITITILKIIAPLFYDKKFFKGRYFKTNEGWGWVLTGIWRQKILGFNRHIPWPVNHSTMISNYKRIHFDINDINNFQSAGCYFQNFAADIKLGKGVYIAPNVGIITANHDFSNLEKHLPGKDVIIGENCWIGMNSIILPGVELGNNIIVGSGSVVTKSFLEGSMIIAGNPAKIIRKLDKH
ncbi:acyltransferase [uncultured Algibacter sp.]|uniref:acyltransferase n=1 Tax=uncultured Algibacter sp. TaxID=298659 RepID=UPI00262C1911|nr:acyltransferase [uncultured Algibacter sp.]